MTHGSEAPSPVAVIGAGVIGAGWAARFLLHGHDVRVFDPDAATPARLEAVIAAARRSLPGLAEVAMPPEGTLVVAGSVAEAVTGAHWVQESASGRLDAKRASLAEIERHCPPGAILASSTTDARPSALAESAGRPERVVLARPLDPVYLLPLVELAGAAESVARATAFLESVGMHPLVARRGIDADLADRVPEVFRHEALLATISMPSDEPPGHLSSPEREHRRDDNLVAMLRALKGRDHGAGASLNRHDTRLREAVGVRAALDVATLEAIPEEALSPDAPIETIRRTVPIDWTDYNGHMNESRYGQVFSDAADAVLALLGCDADYVATGLSWFTVDIRIRFLLETHAGESIVTRTTVLDGGGKKLRLFHAMERADGTPLASGEQLLLHVSLETRRTCLPEPPVDRRLDALVRAHAALERPDGASS